MSLLKCFLATKVPLTWGRSGRVHVDSDTVPDQSPPPADPTPAVAVIGLVKRYGTTEAVSGLDLTARAGQITALLGPNGAGKTSTVECCEGLRRPDAGTVRVLGLDPARDARALRPRVGVMLQDGGLPSTVPATEALHHVAKMYAAPRDVAELTDRLGLAAFARTQVRRLSGGQRQRLALATAVVGRPEVVFLDEPSAGMDPQARLAVWELVRELRASGTAIVLTTHQMAEAEQLADHVVVVDHGRVVTAGTVPEVIGDEGVVKVTVQPVDNASPAPDAALPVDDLAEAVTRALAGAPTAPRVVATAAVDTVEVHAPATPELLHEITGWAARRGLLVTSMTSGRRTLEDVFLELTGRELR